MNNSTWTLFCLALTAVIFVSGCSKPSNTVIEVKHYPIENLEGLITRTDVVIDKAITSDGNGSLRITVNEPTTLRLYETGDVDIENARLTYQAKVRTEGIEGKVYLEMWCQFTGKGEFFSRDLSSPLSGTTDWSTEETPFFLKKGENPDNVKLNLVIEGKGTVWIDDIYLFKGSLK
ncbi:MAG: hypothetical protein HZA15_17260 [Nitrospirae bacterium]|nr:hypothetical protein [Nitrospirota bacterium]